MPMIATIAKQFTFHAAHQLPNHDGACARVHGHTYKVEVAIVGEVKRPCGDSDEGMVLDFGILKDVYKEDVEPLVEHQFLNETLKGVVPETDGTPLTTAENLADWIARVYGNNLGQEVVVTVWETPTSYARVQG